jgi:L-asparaginase
MVKNHIHIIKTGGTIEFLDPAYEEMNKKLMKLDASIESYFKHLIKPHFTFSTEAVSEKDSRDITETDRIKIARAVETSPHNNILITHGTFTMKQTADFLEKYSFPDKKIILTGAMIPITGFAASDAGFNLGFAIASFEHLESGIYLSMNGGIFKQSEVAKNKSLFRFE